MIFYTFVPTNNNLILKVVRTIKKSKYYAIRIYPKIWLDINFVGTIC